jgi:hypothetical protein
MELNQAGSCEYGNEPSGSAMKGGGFLYQQSDYQNRQKASVS